MTLTLVQIAVQEEMSPLYTIFGRLVKSVKLCLVETKTFLNYFIDIIKVYYT